MSDAAVAEALDKVLTRLDALEQKVDRVAGPLARLSDPATADTLDRILLRLDGLETVVNTASRMRTTMPIVADMLADRTTALIDQKEAEGVDVVLEGVRAAEIAQKAIHPRNLDLLERVLDDAERLAVLLDVARAATDAFEEAGVDPAALAKDGAVLAAKLAPVLGRPELAKVLDAGMLEPTGLSTLAETQTALVEARKEPAQSLSPFGLIGALFDPDLQRAMGFFVKVGKRFGRVLQA